MPRRVISYQAHFSDESRLGSFQPSPFDVQLDGVEHIEVHPMEFGVGLDIRVEMDLETDLKAEALLQPLAEMVTKLILRNPVQFDQVGAISPIEYHSEWVIDDKGNQVVSPAPAPAKLKISRVSAEVIRSAKGFTPRKPQRLKGPLKIRNPFEALILRQCHGAMRIPDEVNRYLRYYGIMALLAEGSLGSNSQQNVDKLILKWIPSMLVQASPLGKGRTETLITKCRNDIAHPESLDRDKLQDPSQLRELESQMRMIIQYELENI